MKRILFLVFVIMFFPMAVYAQTDPFEVMGKCNAYGDFALTARALAVEGVPAEQADRVLGRIYILSSEATPDTPKEMFAIVNAARASKQSPPDFANAFLKRCMEFSGDVRSALGLMGVSF